MPGDVLGNVAALILAWAALAVAVGILWKVAPVRWVRHAIGRSIDDWLRGAVTDVLDNGTRLNARLDDIASRQDDIAADVERLRRGER